MWAPQRGDLAWVFTLVTSFMWLWTNVSPLCVPQSSHLSKGDNFPRWLWGRSGAWHRRAQCHCQQSCFTKRWTSTVVFSVLLWMGGCLHTRGIQDGEGERLKKKGRCEWLGVLRYALLLYNKSPQISWPQTMPCSYPPFLWVRIWAQLSWLLCLGPLHQESGLCLHLESWLRRDWLLGPLGLWAEFTLGSCVTWGLSPGLPLTPGGCPFLLTVVGSSQLAARSVWSSRGDPHHLHKLPD